MKRYLAIIYADAREVDKKSGDDADELYNWMLLTVQGKFGNLSGEITDNSTKEVIRSFRKSPSE